MKSSRSKNDEIVDAPRSRIHRLQVHPRPGHNLLPSSLPLERIPSLPSS